ncbi:MAG: hypothetical protein K8H84_12370 [Sulfuricella denitrificans]|nr:hypothetical protein [Sulfuricella denitrificans]
MMMLQPEKSVEPQRRKSAEEKQGAIKTRLLETLGDWLIVFMFLIALRLRAFAVNELRF